MVNTTTLEAPFFGSTSIPPLGGSKDFFLRVWNQVRNRGISPTFSGPLDETDELRVEFLTGARALGFELVDLDDTDAVNALAAMDPPRQPLQPQQLLLADALNAGRPSTVVEIPRRSAKSTTIFAWCFGRMLSRPGYKITFSAQSGVIGTQMLEEWSTMLDAVNPPDDLDLPPWLRGKPRTTKAQQRHAALFGDELVTTDDDGRGFHIYRGASKLGITFTNRSRFYVVKPDAAAYRSKAADVSWVDEAQEIPPDESAALLAGILPLQDTRPNAMTVVSGTAGEVRAGVLWDYLSRLREGDPAVGGVDFAAPDGIAWATLEDKTKAMDILAKTHPGIGTLTTLDKMRERYDSIPLPQWVREYLSIWPETAGARAIPAEQWANAKHTRNRPAIPALVSFGMAIKRNGSAACIVAAWRDSRGNAYIEVVDHRAGTQWLPKRAQELTRKYRGSTIAYDDIGQGRALATEMLALSPKPRLRSINYNDQGAAVLALLAALERGKLKHFDQLSLNVAVNSVTKREVRTDRGVFLWKPAELDADITPVDAATLALRNWDQYYARRARRALEAEQEAAA